jgi:hypothetical protein
MSAVLKQASAMAVGCTSAVLKQALAMAELVQ